MKGNQRDNRLIVLDAAEKYFAARGVHKMARYIFSHHIGLAGGSQPASPRPSMTA
jgi:hypothetical protein